MNEMRLSSVSIDKIIRMINLILSKKLKRFYMCIVILKEYLTALNHLIIYIFYFNLIKKTYPF